MYKLDGYYDVRYDHERKLIRISTFGFWNLDVVKSFAGAVGAVSRIAGDKCDTLLNTCRTEIHTPEVSEALARLSEDNKHVMTGRVAVVSPSMLLRMQTKRQQLAEVRYAYFDTEEAALDWLASA